MKNLITFSLLLLGNVIFGQGFTYSYVDPCSKELKSLQITNSQAITVNYLGNINSFTANDFSNGNFDTWINQITAAAADQPCDELLTNTQSSQNMFITQNIISTLTSVTAASTMTASNAVANSVSNSSSSGSSRGGKKNKNSNNQNSSDNQSNSSSNGTNTNSQANTSPGSTTQGGGTQSGGNTSSGSSTTGGSNSQGGTNNQSNQSSSSGGGTTQRGVNNQGSGSSNNNTNPSPTGGKSNSESNQPNTSQGNISGEGTPKQTQNSGGGTGGTTNSVSNAAEASSSGSGKKGGRANLGSIIGTGDIVAIRVNEDKSNQFRGTMSMTHSNTNNTRSKGFLLNYTTTVRNSNLTLYGAFTNPNKKRVYIVANSSMIDFDRNFFNTTTALESKTFGKTSMMFGLNLTAGLLAGEGFTNISAVGGGFHPFKINKNLSGNLLVLGVYSPFTKFYEGKWWDSGWLIVPFSSWDYSISKNFKYNVSLSGTYEVKGNFLQFQILTGGKILL